MSSYDDQFTDRFFARSAEVDNELSRSDCNAFRHTPTAPSVPAQAIAERLLMYQELLENVEKNEKLKKLDDDALASVIQLVPTQEGGSQETDSSVEKFKFNFADLRRHLLFVCREVFSGERVAQCKLLIVIIIACEEQKVISVIQLIIGSASRLLIDLAIIIKYCYSFCKRLILLARRTVGALRPMQVFSVLCEVVSAILTHLVNIQWREIVRRVGGWVRPTLHDYMVIAWQDDARELVQYQ